MSNNKNTTVTRARFLSILTGNKRTIEHVQAATAYLSRGSYDNALWCYVRRVTDGVTGEDVAREAGVSPGLVSQRTNAVRTMIDAGIPLPSRDADAAASEPVYVHVLRERKINARTFDDAVKQAAGMADVSARMWALLNVTAPKASESSAKRAARPNDGTKANKGNETPGRAVSAAGATEVPSTVTGRLKALLSDLRNGTPVDNFDRAAELLAELSEALAERATTVETVDA